MRDYRTNSKIEQLNGLISVLETERDAAKALADNLQAQVDTLSAQVSAMKPVTPITPPTP